MSSKKNFVAAIGAALFMNLIFGATALAAALENGKYTGSVPTGTSTTMSCTVTIESNGPFAKKITIESERLAEPMYWSYFWTAGDDHQVNNLDYGFIDINRDAAGNLDEVQMQYELQPNIGPFNTSVVNEMCVGLVRN